MWNGELEKRFAVRIAPTNPKNANWSFDHGTHVWKLATRFGHVWNLGPNLGCAKTTVVRFCITFGLAQNILHNFGGDPRDRIRQRKPWLRETQRRSPGVPKFELFDPVSG